MAVVRMKKVYLIAHESHRTKLIETLHQLGSLRITAFKKDEKLAEEKINLNLRSGDEEKLKELDLQLSKIQFASDFVCQFEPKKRGFFGGFIKEKVKVSRRRFERIQNTLNFEQIYNDCENLDIELNSLQNQLLKIRTLRANLNPWYSLLLDLKEIKETKETIILAGEIPVHRFSQFQGEIEKKARESAVYLLNQDSQVARVIFVFHKSHAVKLYSLFPQYGFRQVAFPGFEKTPAEEIARLDQKRAEISQELNNLRQKIAGFCRYKNDLIILRDFIENERKKVEIQKNFSRTKQTFIMECWLPAEKTDILKNQIGRFSEEIELNFLDTSASDDPPVVLKNNRLVAPFEVITRLYGLPDYDELDPTPYLAPFFFLFFGLALGDFGYGLILAFASWWLGKRLDVSENVQRFFNLLIYGGISSMIVGVITGSYFGVEIEKLPPVLKSLILFNPLEDALTFLVGTWALGVIQVLFGIVLKAINNIRRKQILDAFFYEVTTLVFLIAALSWITLWFATMTSPSLSGGIKRAYSLVTQLLGVASLGVILFQGEVFMARSIGDVFKRIGSGLYNLYGMTSYIGDFLSYARLMVLGLATGLIGGVVNILAGLALQIPILGIFLLILVLVGGHLFTLLINILGAFIHPLRLQYVEFFTKFYDGKGRKVEPFGLETKSLVFTNNKQMT